MARIEWVELRLKNWALWKAREASGGVGGMAGVNWSADRVDGDRYREAKLPVNDDDAAGTNSAVESLRLPRRHLYDTLQMFYVDPKRDNGIKGTAQRLGCAESTVHARLSEADRALAQWFTELTERQKANKSVYLQHAQAVRSERDAVVVTRRSYSEKYFANRD